MEEKTLQTMEPASISEAKTQAALAEINFDDPMLTVNYGAKTLGEIAKFTDSVLSNVRVKDATAVGQNLTDLMQKVKGFDVNGVAEKSFLESIPIIGSLFNKASRAVAQFDTVSGQIDKITAKLDEAQFGLLTDIAVLEQFYKHNENFYNDLTAYIKAGEQKLAEARAVDLPKLEAKVKDTNDNFDAQVLRDFSDRLGRFEKRLHDLKLSRAITVQTAPQIRMIQNNDRTLAEKIQTSILTTIPIWKNQLVLALSLRSQKDAAMLQKHVSDTTNEMLRKNAEMLHTATVETAKEVNRSLVDIETLKQTQANLLATIEESIAINEEGQAKRRAADAELTKMEEELRARLVDLSARVSQQKIAGAKA